MDNPLGDIHPCTDIPDDANTYQLAQDKNCLSIIEEQYSMDSKKPTQGSMSTTFFMTSNDGKKDKVILKVIPYVTKPKTLSWKYVNRELMIACELGSLKSKLFVRTRGWLLCDYRIDDSVPKKLTLDDDEQQTKPPRISNYMYLFSDHAGVPLDRREINYTFNEYIMFAFYIIYYLYSARKTIGFVHGDLHGGNILILKRESPFLKIRFDGIDFDVLSPRGYLPMIIDFGYSGTHKTENNGFIRSDLESVIDEIQNAIRSSPRNANFTFDFPKTHLQNMEKGEHDFFKELLRAPIFDRLRRNQTTLERGIHPCNQLPTEFPLENDMQRDRDCNDLIFDHYEVDDSIKFSQGAKSVTIALIDNENGAHIMLKTTPYRIGDSKGLSPQLLVAEANAELKIACRLNGLKEKTPVFIRTFGWLLCSQIPAKLKTHITALRLGGARIITRLFTFIEYSGVSLRDSIDTYSPDEYHVFAFLLLHALYVARRDYGYLHGDLHKGNVLIDTTAKPNEELELQIEGETYYVTIPSNRFPKIIDFGRSSMSDINSVLIEEEGDTEITRIGSSGNPDMQTVIAELETHGDIKFGLDQKSLANMKRDDYQTIASLLTKSAAFQTIREKSDVIVRTRRKRQDRSTERCISCGMPATLKWNTHPHIVACSVHCGNKVAGLVYANAL